MIGGVLVLLIAIFPGQALLERPDPEVAAGIAALQDGNPEEALVRFDRAIRRHPDQGRLHYNRGLALQALGRLDEAQEAFAQALRVGGASREALHGLGHLHAAKGEVDQAISSFKSALARDPDVALARRNLEALLRQKQQQEGPEPEAGESEEPDESEENESPEGQDEEESSEGPDEEGESSEEERTDEGEGEEEPEGESESGEDSESQDEASEGQGESEPGAENEEDSEGAGAESGGAAEEEPGDERSGAEGAAEQVEEATPSETERILDALKAREKSLQLFRGQERKGRQTDVEKDW